MKSTPNSTIEAVKQFIRQPFAWPGGYQQVLVMDDGECLCSECATSEFKLIVQATKDSRRDSWQPSCVDIHWEGEPLTCAHCSNDIESAYGV